MAATTASAQQGLRATDQVYDRQELSGMLSDHAVEFFDGSVSRYRADGVYSYKYTETDRPWLGTWSVPEAGQVCIAFENGSDRCDIFVSDGARMVMIIDNGTRFPVRERRALVDGY
ncbi:MAG: hypothetical protein QNJ16_00295 [Rhodobacter sp.]|nr:hypothetical protein [Rhodobacter sp.]